MQNPLITLNEALRIGKGGTRICYLHPDNPDIIIKVEKEGTPSHFTPNDWEYRHYTDIVRLHGRVPGIIPILGTVDTQFGKGLMAKAIRDTDGALSPTLSHAALHPDRWEPSAIFSAVKDLTDRIITLDIRLFDFNLDNILLQTTEKNQLQAIIIDLKGHYANCEWIPVSSWFDFLGRRKRNRRVRRLMESLSSVFNDKTAMPE
ncbi:PhoP regulatory network YrbL family protein [Desulfobotulus sp. H1]|uniref:PhoP regulatory network YrbL family protein n=1 Tax=Desulfobotulus pelophilus TaxID=2823377 RepID=A0ABT3N6W9_9BACT|nr:YrbL family protein [Desulfobotulus pelophilus]MCW7753204.1 PhoP regulatory network YrbL family protein [Desulfobotulus pelophilus]